MHAWIDTALELLILVYVYRGYKKESRAVDIAEKEYKYDEDWNNKMLARELRRSTNKKERMQPLEKEMD